MLFTLASAASLLAASSLAAPVSTASQVIPRDGQITCSPSYLGAGKGGGRLILNNSTPNGTSAAGRPIPYVAKSISGDPLSAALVVNPDNVDDVYRFYSCSSKSLGVEAKETVRDDEGNDMTTDYGLLVKTSKNAGDQPLTDGNFQCIVSSQSPPEEDHFQSPLFVSPCTLEDIAEKQNRQFWSVSEGSLVFKYRGLPEFEHYLKTRDGTLDKAQTILVQQGQDVRFNGLYFEDLD